MVTRRHVLGALCYPAAAVAAAAAIRPSSISIAGWLGAAAAVASHPGSPGEAAADESLLRQRLDEMQSRREDPQPDPGREERGRGRKRRMRRAQSRLNYVGE